MDIGIRQKQSKDAAALKNKLLPLLKEFEKIQEWADIGNWLIKLSQLLQQHPTPHIPYLQVLGKRLAQCLFPTLPFGVHSNALRVYDVIFRNTLSLSKLQGRGEARKLLTEIFPFMAVGLFPFFQFSSATIKPELLKLVNKYFLELQHELIPSVVGVIISLVPGLNQTSQEMQKKVFALLEVISDKIGRRFFYSGVWTAILRMPKVRLACFKYLNKEFKIDRSSEKPKQSSEEPIEYSEQLAALLMNRNQVSVQTRFPHADSLVLNALLACFQDEEILVRRVALDIMITFLKLNQQIFSRQAKSMLIQGSLLLLYKKQHSISRRVIYWLFGQPDSQGSYDPLQLSEQVSWVGEGLCELLIMDSWQGQEDRPLRVVYNLLLDCNSLIKQILTPIIPRLVWYINRHRNQSEVSKVSQRMFMSLTNFESLFYDCLVDQLKKALERSSQQAKQVVELINFTSNYFRNYQSKDDTDKPKQNHLSMAKQLVGILVKLAPQELHCHVFVQPLLQLLAKFLKSIDQGLKLDQFFESVVNFAKDQSDSDSLTNTFSLLTRVIVLNYAKVSNEPQVLTNSLLLSVQGSNTAIKLNASRAALELINNPNMVKLLQENSLKLVMSSLYTLIQTRYELNQNVRLLATFRDRFPQRFAFQILESFKSQDPRQLEKAMRRFTLAWNLLNYETSGVGISNMLAFIVHENQILKFIARGWLSQSSFRIRKVLTPLLSNLMVVLSQNRSDSKYDPRPAIGLLASIRTILIYQDEEVWRAIIKEEDLFERIVQVILVCLQNKKGMAEQYAFQYVRINSQACGVLEQLVSDSQKNQCRSVILRMSLQTILSSLQENINSNDVLQQVQLLSLLQQLLLIIPGEKVPLSQRSRLTLGQKLTSLLLVGLKHNKKYYLKTKYLAVTVTNVYVINQIDPASLQNSFIKVYAQLEPLLLSVDTERLVSSQSLSSSQDDFLTFMNLRDALKLAVNLLIQIGNEKQRDRQAQKSLAGLLRVFKGHGIALQSKPQVYKNVSSQVLGKFSRLIYLELHSWPQNKTFQKICRLTNRGIGQPDQQGLFQLSEEINGIINQRSDIRDSVLHTMMGLFCNNRDSFLNQAISIWNNQTTTQIHVPSQVVPVLRKLTEVLVCMKIPADVFLQGVIESNKFKKLITSAQQRPVIPKTLHYVDSQLAQNQLRLISFVYNYFLHCIGEKLKTSSLVKLWTLVIRFSKVILGSSLPQSVLWLTDLLFLVSTRFPIKDLFNDSKYRNDLFQLISCLFQQLAQFSTMAKSFTGRRDFKAGFFGLGSVYDSQPEKKQWLQLLAPLNPSIYVLQQVYKLKTSRTQKSQVEICFLQNSTNMLDTHNFTKRMGFYAIKTLKSVGTAILSNCISADQSFKITNMLRDNLLLMLPILENKQQQNRLFVELISELLLAWIESHRTDMIKQLRKPIMDIFMGNDFFRCSKQTLKYWKKIVGWMGEAQDLLANLLTKEGLLSGIFTGRAESMRQKIKSFQRVCFVVYAGAVDEYQKKMQFLLESINEVIKDIEQTNPALLILIFFCIRIVVLRLSPQSLHQLFRSIWPSLLVLLIQVFDKTKSRKRNPNLILAGLKLLQLLANIDIQEFNLHQWIFVFDFYGVKIESTGKQPNAQEGVIQNPFVHRPYVYNHLPSKINFRVNYVGGEVERPRSIRREKRSLVIREAVVQGEFQLQNKALWLGQHLSQQSQQRMLPNLESIENLIEADFISLDDYIFQIKS